MTDPTRYPFHIDLHVPRSALPMNGKGPDATSLAQLMRERGLSGLVITEHDDLPSSKETARLERAMKGLRVYRAAEVSTSEGHCIVIGLSDLSGIEPGISTWDLVKRADAAGAAVVLVHPTQPTPLTPKPKPVGDMAPGIHGIEVMSRATVSTDELEARLFAHERGWTMVGGSDSLSTEGIGAAYSACPRVPADEGDLAALIRVGAVRPNRAG